MKLVIAEKPDMAQFFAESMSHTGKFTGSKGTGYFKNDHYVITWAYGHLVNGKEPQDYPKEIFGGWNWKSIPFVPPTGKLEYHLPIKTDFDNVRKRQLGIIKQIYKQYKFEEIINACDAEREGHLIGQEIIDVLKMKEPVKRLWVQAKVEEDVKKAFENLRDMDFYGPRVDAAFARQFADYILGHNLTVAFSIKTSSRLHVGRVATPTLSLFVKRKLEIDNFVPKDFFEIKASFGNKYDGMWFKDEKGNTRFDEKVDAETIVSKIAGQVATVVKKDVVKQPVKPKELFSLSTLQGEANKKFGFSMQKTLDIAQFLYDTYKATSYPRTDSKYIMSSQVAELPQLLNAVKTPVYSEFVEDIVSRNIPTSKRFVDDKKVSDHYAIIPTKKMLNLNDVKDEYNNKKELVATKEDIIKVYDLIVRRFLSVFYPDAIYEKTEIVTEVAGETFKTNGRILVDPGWEVVYGKEINESEEENENDEKTLPPIEQGETNTVTDTKLLSKQTKPKPHYNDQTIGTAMENAKDYVEEDELKEEMKEAGAGLGTPATRAQIIENLVARKYITRKGKQLIATDLAVKLIEIAPDRLKTPEVTAEWEQQLRLIEKEEVHKDDFYKKIIQFVEEEIEELKNKTINVVFESQADGNVVGECPKCGQPIVEFPKGFACKTSNKEHTCFRVWKGLLNKTITTNQMKQMLTKGETSIKGFKMKDGRTFDAKIKIKAELDGVEFIRPETKEIDMVCPKCGGKVFDRETFIHCENNTRENPCFSLPKEFGHKKLSMKVLKDLATKGKTELIDGFKSKDKKKTFPAYLKYENGRLEYEFPERKPIERKETGAKCPSCGGDIVEMEKMFGCSNYSAKNCKFTVWKNIGGKEMTIELIQEVLEKKETEKLDGFVSKGTGKPYKAKLVWNPKKKTIEMSFN